MKKYLVSALLIITAAAAVAAPQTFNAPAKSKRTVKTTVRKKTPPPLEKEQARGVLPRAFTAGNNPLQMLNPKAPAKYGTSMQSTVIDPDTGKWKGIKLVEITF
ncbi:MAG: hypothetical protein ABI925_06530 [Verrucomicrobiota bacterium]